MLTSVRAMGSPLVPLASCTDPRFNLSQRYWVECSMPRHTWPLCWAGLARFRSRDVGQASCFSGEGFVNLGLLRALAPLFQPHFDFFSIFRSFLSPFLRISE